MNPLVSILIPCYNASPWLSETIESALNQTWKNTEIILVDDGSTDNSLEVAKFFECRGVKIIHQPNRGASAARNYAISVSKGDWIQFLDADDLLSPNKLEAQLNVAFSKGIDFLYSCQWGRFTGDLASTNFVSSPLLNDSTPVDWLIDKYKRHDMVNPAAWLMHRSLLERSGKWNEELVSNPNDDGEFFDRVVLYSQGIRFVPDAKVHYRVHKLGTSLSSNTSYIAAQSALLSLDLCAERLLNREDSSRVRSALAIQFQWFAYQFAPLYRDLSSIALERVTSMGGAQVPFPGGGIARFLSGIVGWHLIRKLQYFFYQYRYDK